jgi:hypothetical protein
MRHRIFDSAGTLLDEFDEPDGPRVPLDHSGVIATLNAVLGLWPLADAANAVGLTTDDLVAEAEAWAMGVTPSSEPDDTIVEPST